MCIDDFVGGDDSTGTTAELTDVEIVAEVTAEQPNENAAEMDPASADDAPLPTSAEVIAALALVLGHCGAIEGTGLSLVDYIEDAVVKHAIANKKQATLFQYLQGVYGALLDAVSQTSEVKFLAQEFKILLHARWLVLEFLVKCF
ncbi:hypothetical protein HPB50_011013 [Hyalomma asiaticum]|uniref:Uncharacterized protein n=1 Tax=Hyalomma asiaticum TaxID=266040 RepID=A0ACB7RRN0_HYAAI|nr:hypothetical protein HPB50_011013 [Hyalomma asiaticum]